MPKIIQKETTSLGRQYELVAKMHLEKLGLKHIQSNYQCKIGEIDLIFFDKKSNTLSFIEVKYRTSSAYGHPLEMINRSKQQRIKRTSQHYLQRHSEFSRCNCRFDAIALSKSATNHKVEIDWVKDAF